MKKEEKITLKSQLNTMPKLMKKTYKKKTSSKPKVVYVMPSKPELKELTTNVTGSVTINGYQVNLNNLGFGSDTGQRVGRAVKGARLTYNYVILGASASGLIDYLRIMLIYDSQSNVANPAVGDFLEVGAGGSIVTCPKNTKSYPDRFTFLYDKIIAVQNQSTGGSCNGDKEDQAQCGSISLARLPATRFSSSASGVPTTGNLFLYVTSYQNTGLVTTSAGLYGHFKYTYSDD